MRAVLRRQTDLTAADAGTAYGAVHSTYPLPSATRVLTGVQRLRTPCTTTNTQQRELVSF